MLKDIAKLVKIPFANNFFYLHRQVLQFKAVTGIVGFIHIRRVMSSHGHEARRGWKPIGYEIPQGIGNPGDWTGGR